MMAIGNPVEGEVPVPPSLDLAHVGLATPPKAPLLLGKVGPSEPGRADGEGFLVLLFISICCLLVVLTYIFFYAIGSSANILSGWGSTLTPFTRK